MRKDTLVLLWTTIISVVLLIWNGLATNNATVTGDQELSIREVKISQDDFSRLENLSR